MLPCSLTWRKGSTKESRRASELLKYKRCLNCERLGVLDSSNPFISCPECQGAKNIIKRKIEGKTSL